MAIATASRCKFCGTRFARTREPGRPWMRPGTPQPTQPAMHLPPPTALPRRRRRPSWFVWTVLSIVIVVVMVAVTVHQVASKQPLPGEEDAIAGVGDWVTFVDPNHAFSVDFPAEPKVGDEQTTEDRRSRKIEARVLRLWYAVEYYDFFNGATGGVHGENFLDRRASDYAGDVSGKLMWSQRVAVSGLPASEFVVDSPTGVHHVAAVLTGKRLYFFIVIATVDAPKGYARFVGSFKPMLPQN